MKRESVVIVKKGNIKMIDKYKNNIGVREDFIEFNVRGTRAVKIAEYAEVIKYLSLHDATKSFQIPQLEFEKAFGFGKKGITYVKCYLRKFGILFPRVVISQDIVHLWSKNTIK